MGERESVCVCERERRGMHRLHVSQVSVHILSKERQRVSVCERECVCERVCV